MKTLLSHFYNEEYLLPFWLNHHKKIFDHGILIDYQSNDKSVEIIKSICPNWEVIKSRNEFFGAEVVDKEIEDIESNIDGWRICLNTTEFIIGNFNILENISQETNFFIPECIMVDRQSDEFNYPDQNYSLTYQRNNGIHPFQISYAINQETRRNRKFSNFFSKYPTGRHYENYNTEDFLILWYGYSPFNEKTIQRKLQIQDRIPDSDKLRRMGYHHLVNRDDLINKLKTYQNESKDLTDYISKFTYNNIQNEKIEI
jgi:hypothetical protein